MGNVRISIFVVLFAFLMPVRLAPGDDLAISIPIQLTHAQNFDPSPSPDGKRLVFISVISGKEQLFTMDTGGKNIVQLTRDDADHEDPAWSPDGTKIAFVLITKERTSIAVMNADGSNVDVLTPKEHNTIHPNWSADSKQVIYCTNDDLAPPKKNEAQINAVDVPASGGQPLHNSSHALEGSTSAEEAGRPSQFSELAAPQGASRVDLATKKITPLITGGINTYGSWSPDMKQIVFRKIIGDGNSEVFLANADGSNPRNLTNNPFFDGWPAWSPDGKKIAFASNRRGHGYQIFVMDVDGANVRLIANTEGRGTAPRWSPDGKTIYFTNCVEKDYGTDCEILMASSEPQPIGK